MNNKLKINNENNMSNTTSLISGDIIGCVLNNDFSGVDRVLEETPERVNFQIDGLLISPLIIASGYGMERMVAHLLSKPGVDIHIRDSNGMNALEHGRAYPSIVKRILAHEYPDSHWAGKTSFPNPGL